MGSTGSTDDTRFDYNTPQHTLNQPACDHSLLNSLLITSQAPRNTSIRPLTAAYKAANSEHEVSLGSMCVLVFLMHINRSIYSSLNASQETHIISVRPRIIAYRVTSSEREVGSVSSRIPYATMFNYIKSVFV